MHNIIATQSRARDGSAGQHTIPATVTPHTNKHQPIE